MSPEKQKARERRGIDAQKLRLSRIGLTAAAAQMGVSYARFCQLADYGKRIIDWSLGMPIDDDDDCFGPRQNAA